MAQKILAIFAGLILAFVASAADFALVKDGKATSRIVLPDNAGPAEKHAASELAVYLEKVTGAKLNIGSAPSKELYNVYLGTAGAKNVPRSAAIDQAVARLQDDGFVLAADKDGLRIVGKKPVGVLYGVYEILKNHADVRWFAPGSDFEYCPKKPTVTVAEQVTVRNPWFKVRNLSGVCCKGSSKITATWDWLVRNGMNIGMGKGQYNSADMRLELEKRGAELSNGGGHCFSTLLSDKLFDEHPEYFALINGKRTPQSGKLDILPGQHQPGGQANQPCTSNPKVVEIMAKSLAGILDASLNPRGMYRIGNNDSQGWCQCDKCAALDPLEEKENQYVSTRFYTLCNQLAAEVYKTHPDAEFMTFAYQNFQYPPIGVIPDPRFVIQACIHGRCYRHSMADLSCAANERYRDILGQWGKLKNTVTTLEYLGGDCEFPAYAPIEKTFAADIKYYKQIGLGGCSIYTVPPDGDLIAGYTSPRYQEEMLTKWQMYYIAAKLFWDPDADYDAIYEDMGAKYYGKTWDVMRQYRALLIKSFAETPGHILGCGGTPGLAMGKCLEKPGVEKQLVKLLDDAEKLAGDDPAAVAKVKRDRRYFQDYWQAMHKELLALQQKELKVKKRTARIVIDGKIDEAEWGMATAVTGFVALGGKVAADPQTSVKMLYDEDNIYLAVEAMEPMPGRMTIRKTGRDDSVWNDSSIEFFINAPGMNDKYVQIVVNPKGVVYDSKAVTGNNADVKFDSGVEVKTTVLSDRWIAEVRIPTAAMGLVIKDGDVWKINVARNRRLDGEKSQSSSWSNGVYHGPDAYRPAVFGMAAPRQSEIPKAPEAPKP